MYSLIFNIGITYFVISNICSINIESKFTKYLLYSIPPDGFGVEVTIDQVLKYCMFNQEQSDNYLT